jgi:hypothetical protein
MAKSRYRGVSWKADRRKFVSQIHTGGRQIYLGSFDSEIEASDAYNKARAANPDKRMPHGNVITETERRRCRQATRRILQQALVP